MPKIRTQSGSRHLCYEPERNSVNTIITYLSLVINDQQIHCCESNIVEFVLRILCAYHAEHNKMYIQFNDYRSFRYNIFSAYLINLIKLIMLIS